MCQQKDEPMLIQSINAACSPRANGPSDHSAPDGRLPGTATPTVDTGGARALASSNFEYKADPDVASCARILY
jgi:hypothetical protein